MATSKRVAATPADLEFIDMVFSRRVLILSSGRAVPVIGGRVAAAASDDELCGFLQAHQEFKRVEG